MTSAEQALTRAEELLEAKRQLLEGPLPEDWMAKTRALLEEIRQLKSVEDFETFDAIVQLEMRRKGVEPLSEMCGCGHRQGVHNGSIGCLVGRDKWNARYRRTDKHCGCRGFIRKEEFERLQAEEAEERAEALETAEYWCTQCDQAVDDPTAKYECSECGTEFTYADEGTHQCPNCRRFAGKQDGDFCPDCGEELITGEEKRAQGGDDANG